MTGTWVLIEAPVVLVRASDEEAEAAGIDMVAGEGFRWEKGSGS